MEDKINFEAMRSSKLINEIDKITDLDLSYKYKLILIENIIERWREDWDTASLSVEDTQK